MILLIRAFGRSKGGEADPTSGTCGGCGYNIKGNVGFNCPECGADLRMVGIRPAGQRKGLPTAALITIVLVVILFMWVICTGLLFLNVGDSTVVPARAPVGTNPGVPTSEAMTDAPAAFDATGPPKEAADAPD